MLKDRDNQEDSNDCSDIPIEQQPQWEMDTDGESDDEANEALESPELNYLLSIIRAIDIDGEASPETWIEMIQDFIDQ